MCFLLSNCYNRQAMFGHVPHHQSWNWFFWSGIWKWSKCGRKSQPSLWRMLLGKDEVAGWVMQWMDDKATAQSSGSGRTWPWKGTLQVPPYAEHSNVEIRNPQLWHIIAVSCHFPAPGWLWSLSYLALGLMVRCSVPSLHWHQPLKDLRFLNCEEDIRIKEQLENVCSCVLSDRYWDALCEPNLKNLRCPDTGKIKIHGSSISGFFSFVC